MKKKTEFGNIGIQLALLAAHLVLKNYGEAERLMNRLLENGVEQNILREAIIQTYLFDGYPTALEGLFLLCDILKEDNRPPPAEDLKADIIRKWQEQGESACRIIYNHNYSRLISNVEKLSPDLANWMIVEGYGKTLSRDALDLKVREFINVAILAVKGYPRQLHSHLKGSINAGAAHAEIGELLKSLEPLNPDSIGKAYKLWKNIKLRK